MEKIKKYLISFILIFGLIFIPSINVIAEEEVQDTPTISEPSSYNIAYELSGGTNNTANPEIYDGSSDITLKNPTRTGYTFKGWYLDSDYSKSITTITSDLKEDITVYAKWEANSYTIKFDGNSGTGKMSNVSVKYDKSYTLTANKFTKKGYTFTGWNTKKDGKGTTYKDKASIKNLIATNKGTVTLYAQWKKTSYKITYNLNGGKNSSSNPATYTMTTATINLKNPTKTGYTFKGWYSDSKFKNKVTSIKKGSTGNKTLYAKWEANSYTIKFDANGGKGKMSNLSLKYNASKALTANKFTRTGYTFTGWNTKKDGKGTTYKNKASIKNLTSKNKGTITLYAQWKKNTYTIKYNLNGGKAPSNPTSYTVTTATINLKNPTKTGYTFKGWYSDSKFKKKVTSIKKGSTGNKTLYAKWEANSYTIKFDANGGKGKMSNLSLKYNASKALTANKFTRTGYTFTGWNTKKDGKGTTYKNKASIKNLTSKNKGTVTLYAQWKKTSYKITYNLNGGKNSSSNPATYTIATSTITLKNPTRSGYTFKGWYSDSKFKNKVTTIKKGSTGNKTLYAKWAKKYLLVSKTSTTFRDTDTIKVTLKAKGQVIYEIEDTSIVTAEWGSFVNDDINLYLTAEHSGSTYIKITNTYNSESYRIKVTVQKPWEGVKVSIPSTLGESGDEGNRVKILSYQFYDEDYLYYQMHIEFQFVQIKNHRTNWGEYFYYYDSDGNILDKGYLYADNIAVGKIYKDDTLIPRGTAYIEFREYPEIGSNPNPSIPDVPDTDPSDSNKWTYTDATNLNNYLKNASSAISTAVDYSEKAVKNDNPTTASIYLGMALTDMENAYSYLEAAENLALSRADLTTTGGSSLLLEIQAAMASFENYKNYEITSDNAIELRQEIYNMSVDAQVQISSPYTLSVKLLEAFN